MLLRIIDQALTVIPSSYSRIRYRQFLPGPCDICGAAQEPGVFVSYRWGGMGEALVDELEGLLGARGVPLVRDESAMRYRDTVRDFMRTLGAGKAIVVVVDDACLRSENCTFELTEIAGSRVPVLHLSR